ncbi:cell division cycle protein 27 homolog [Euwallacea similis]|uniref:cell division cycle protein 27 homolog n=1 Tax=Euwallacea similis TaxID=1736056 RepID=UPI00344FC90C
MIIQEPVEAAIWHCLNHYDYPDAIFLSERLYAEVKSSETLFLLATAYYRSGRKAQAYNALLNGCEHEYSPQCQLLHGVCAFELEKYAEAESAIVTTADGSTRTLDDVVVDFGDQASFALMLLGKIASKYEGRLKAAETWRKALRLNPFLFSAFELLCNLGEKPDASSVFQADNIENMSTCQGQLNGLIESVILHNNTECSTASTPPQILSNAIPPSIKRKARSLTGVNSMSPTLVSGCNPLLFNTHIKHSNLLKFRATESEVEDSPSFGLLLDNSWEKLESTPELPLIKSPEPCFNIAKRLRSHEVEQNVTPHNKESLVLLNCKPVLSQSQGWQSASHSPPVSGLSGASTPLMLEPNQNVRRSSRLFSSSSVKENDKSNRDMFAFPKLSSPKASKKVKQRVARNLVNKNTNMENQNQVNENKSPRKEKCETVTSQTDKSGLEQQVEDVFELQKESINGLMSLLRTLGQAYCALSSYDCKSAIEHLQLLSSNQFNTPWVQCLLALSYFEMNDYETCVKHFQLVHAQHPYRLDYMDVYSTALWHLQKEVALSALAQDLISTDKNHPATWCVNGNCFSMHKEHDTAIKFFQRAVQVDPNFHYAYTLLGHEYITTEELDNALCCFRNAIRINARHYNAWFGIGTIYSKQERYNLGEMYYNRALAINPTSSVILCHIGIVQHALNKTEKALETFNKAIITNPKSALCKFHRGSLYFAIGQHSEALKELEELKEIVPKESSVYYLIGKVHKKLGNTDLALQHFSWATDLDPKGASSQVKEAFDPAIGRGSRSFCSNAEMSENPQSPDDYESANSANQGESINFDGLPDDSEDSTFD